MKTNQSLYLQALDLHKKSQFQEAARIYAQVLDEDANHIDAIMGLALIMYEALKLERSAALFERAIELASDRYYLYSNYGRTLRRLERCDDAIDASQKACNLAPDQPLMWVNLGLLYHDMQQIDEAVTAYDQALAIDKYFVPALAAKGHSLMEKRPSIARECLEQALRIQPEYPLALRKISILYIAMAEPERTLKINSLLLQKNALDWHAMVDYIVALHEVGQFKEAESLLGYERFLQKHMIDIPAGYDSVDGFNKALVAHIENHPALTDKIRSHAITNGRRVDNISVSPKGPIEHLEELIKEHVMNYLNTMPANLPDHPMLQLQGKEINHIKAWAVLLENSGYETPHCHPDGFISGVYYPKIPAVIDDKGQQGWIEFGEPYSAYHVQKSFSKHAIQPEEGAIVLFPSYFWHKTIPFEGDATRISIAFDIKFATTS